MSVPWVGGFFYTLGQVEGENVDLRMGILEESVDSLLVLLGLSAPPACIAISILFTFYYECLLNCLSTLGQGSCLTHVLIPVLV